MTEKFSPDKEQAAEDFETVYCFHVFNLSNFPKLTAEVLKSSGLPTQFDVPLKRLAGAFQVEWTALKQEFFDIGSIALSRIKEMQSENLDAWVWALARAASSFASRQRHPVSNLEVVLAEYACMSSSDSVIERDFSRMKWLLSEQQLNASTMVESDFLMLAVSDPSHDKRVIQVAGQVWQELYSSARSRPNSRFDKGVARLKAAGQPDEDLTPEKPTEGQFKKRRRGKFGCPDLSAAVPASSSEAWTEGHDKEVTFNAKKQLNRLFEAVRSGSVDAAELPVPVLEECVAHFRTVESNLHKREQAERRLASRLKNIQPLEEELMGLRAFVPDAVRTPQLDRDMESFNWHVNNELAEAQVLVYQFLDDGELPLHVAVAAALNGAWPTTPAMSTWVKLQRAGRTRRKVFCTNSFKTANPEVMSVLHHLAGHAGPNFQLIHSFEEFAVAKNVAEHRKVSASVIALHAEHEAPIFDGINHAFKLEGFKEFTFKIDLNKSYFQQ